MTDRFYREVLEVDPRRVYTMPPQVKNSLMDQRPWQPLIAAVERWIAVEPGLSLELTPWTACEEVIAQSGGLGFERAMRRRLMRDPDVSSEVTGAFERALRAWRQLMVIPANKQAIAMCREAFDTLHRMESDLRESAALTPRVWQRMLYRDPALKPQIIRAAAPDLGFLGLTRASVWRDVRARGKWEPDVLRMMGYRDLDIIESDLDLFTDKLDGRILPMWFTPLFIDQPGRAHLTLWDVTLRLPTTPRVTMALEARRREGGAAGELDPELGAGDWLGAFLEDAGLRLAIGMVERVNALHVHQRGRWELVQPNGETWIMDVDQGPAEDGGSIVYQQDVAMVYMPFMERAE